MSSDRTSALALSPDTTTAHSRSRTSTSWTTTSSSLVQLRSQQPGCWQPGLFSLQECFAGGYASAEGYVIGAGFITRRTAAPRNLQKLGCLVHHAARRSS